MDDRAGLCNQTVGKTTISCEEFSTYGCYQKYLIVRLIQKDSSTLWFQPASYMRKIGMAYKNISVPIE